MIRLCASFLPSFKQLPLPHAKSLLLAICLVVAWYTPQLGERVFGSLEQLGARLAKKKNLMIVGIAAAVILVRVNLLGLLPIPIPVAHDEFGYLLSADTFAHGRLTNPPHPLWIFLDTFHVNQRPTYMSKFPPAQGGVLALGQLLGHPWIGVLLSVSAMCAALLWALQGWLPPAWALLGATFVAVRIGIFNYWMNSYFGGAVAAIGGALVIGALPRILRDQRPRDACLLGLGAGILANSRPVEGFVFCLPVALVLGVWLFSGSSPSLRTTLPRIVFPIGVFLALTCAFIAYYNWRGTGNPLLSPYVLNQRTYYRGQPIFIWQKKLPPTHTMNPIFDSFYNNWPGDFDGTWRGLMSVTWKKLIKFRDFYLFTESALLVPLLALPWLLRKGKLQFLIAQAMFCCVIMVMVVWLAPNYALAVLSTLPLLGLLWLLRDGEVRFLVIELGFCFIGLLMVNPFLEHYAAPITGVFLVLLVQAIRYLRRWEHRGRPVGVGLSRVVVLFAVGMFPVLVAQAIRDPASLPSAAVPVAPEWSRTRARIEAQLEAMPGQHLVIVRYSPQHAWNEEIVYNRADIDHSKVVWAREIPGVEIRPLLDYFRGRHIWLDEPDVSPRLTVYPIEPQTTKTTSE
jgi:hypothetical protein